METISSSPAPAGARLRALYQNRWMLPARVAVKTLGFALKSTVALSILGVSLLFTKLGAELFKPLKSFWDEHVSDGVKKILRPVGWGLYYLSWPFRFLLRNTVGRLFDFTHWAYDRVDKVWPTRLLFDQLKRTKRPSTIFWASWVGAGALGLLLGHLGVALSAKAGLMALAAKFEMAESLEFGIHLAIMKVTGTVLGTKGWKINPDTVRSHPWTHALDRAFTGPYEWALRFVNQSSINALKGVDYVRGSYLYYKDRRRAFYRSVRQSFAAILPSADLSQKIDPATGYAQPMFGAEKAEPPGTAKPRSYDAFLFEAGPPDPAMADAAAHLARKLDGYLAHPGEILEDTRKVVQGVASDAVQGAGGMVRGTLQDAAEMADRLPLINRVGRRAIQEIDTRIFEPLVTTIDSAVAPGTPFRNAFLDAKTGVADGEKPRGLWRFIPKRWRKTAVAQAAPETGAPDPA